LHEREIFGVALPPPNPLPGLIFLLNVMVGNIDLHAQAGRHDIRWAMSSLLLLTPRSPLVVLILFVFLPIPTMVEASGSIWGGGGTSVILTAADFAQVDNLTFVTESPMKGMAPSPFYCIVLRFDIRCVGRTNKDSSCIYRVAFFVSPIFHSLARCPSLSWAVFGWPTSHISFAVLSTNKPTSL